MGTERGRERELFVRTVAGLALGGWCHFLSSASSSSSSLLIAWVCVPTLPSNRLFVNAHDTDGWMDGWMAKRLFVSIESHTHAISASVCMSVYVRVRVHVYVRLWKPSFGRRRVSHCPKRRKKSRGKTDKQAK